MNLTGKAKQDFEKWYLGYLKEHSERLISGTGVEWFNLLTDSMQWGVLVDFFDSKGFYLDIQPIYTAKPYEFWVNIVHKREVTHIDDKMSRPEARKAAIEKANELYNSQL